MSSEPIKRKVVNVLVEGSDASLILDDGSMLTGLLAVEASAHIHELSRWTASGYVFPHILAPGE